MRYDTKMAELLAIARKGTLRARELDEAEIPRAYLQRLRDRGELVRVARGVYRLPDAPITERLAHDQRTRPLALATATLASQSSAM